MDTSCKICCGKMGWKGLSTVEIDELFHMLSWSSDEETQKKGKEIAGQSKYLSAFLQPIEDKSVWNNCAEIFASKSDEELKPYLFDLLKWLQDINWPGSFTVMERLQRYNPSLLVKPYVYCVNCAWKLEDEEWLHNLAGLLSVPGLKESLPPNHKAALEDIYRQDWSTEDEAF